MNKIIIEKKRPKNISSIDSICGETAPSIVDGNAYFTKTLLRSETYQYLIICQLINLNNYLLNNVPILSISYN